MRASRRATCLASRQREEADHTRLVRQVACLSPATQLPACVPYARPRAFLAALDAMWATHELCRAANTFKHRRLLQWSMASADVP